MGKIFTFFFCASFVTNIPEQTRLSLFARAISFLCSMAVKVACSPEYPTTAVITISISGIVTTSDKAAFP